MLTEHKMSFSFSISFRAVSFKFIQAFINSLTIMNHVQFNIMYIPEA